MCYSLCLLHIGKGNATEGTQFNMKYTFTTRLGGIAVCIFSMLCAGFSQDKLSLEEAINLALKNNGNALASLSAITSAEARLQGSRASLLPSVSPDYSYTRSRSDVNGRSITSDDRSASLSVNWLLIDSGQRDLNVRQSSRSLEATRLNTQNTLRNLSFQTTRSYYDLLRRKELLKVSDSSVERARTLLELAKFQADPAIGTAPVKDVLQAEADLANAEVQQISAQNNLETSKTELKRVIGWQLTRALPDLIDPEAPQPETALPPLERLWDQALMQRPDVRSAEQEVLLQQISIQSARLDTLPSFQLRASAARQFEPRNSDLSQLRFTASYPLFDGGLTRSNLRSAEANLQSAQYRLEQTKRDALADVEIAYLSLSETERRLNASQKAVAAARKNYEAARDSLQEGAGTIIEVITAQLSLITAETNYVQAIYDYYIAEAQLKLAVGEPLTGE